MDFYDDIRRFVLAQLPHKSRDRALLEQKRVSELLVLFFNWRSRHVPVRPRTVHQSADLLANDLAADPQYQPALAHIITLIEKGGDLTPHLSSFIDNKWDPNAKPGSYQPYTSHLDLLLNDWGIHHLHLSTGPIKKGRVPRTDPVLFAVFKRDDAYLIDIIPEHGRWTDDTVIRTIVKEWPTAGIVNRLGWFTRLETPVSETRRKRLREGHLMVPIEIDRALYAPARLLTTAGTSGKHTDAANEVLRRVREFEERLQKEPEYVNTLLIQNGITPPPTLDLHFAFFSNEAYGIIEGSTGLGIYLSR